MSLKKSIFILLFPVAFVFQQNPKQIRIFQNEHLEVLNGRVKQLITSGLDTRGTPLLMRYADTIIFDRDGNEKEIRFYKHDNYKGIKILKSIPKGKAYVIEEPFSKGDGKLVTSYDADGKIKERSAYNADGFYGKSLYFYDNLDRIVETKVYDKSGTFGHKIAFQYDVNGLLTKEAYFRKGSEKYYSRAFYRYDSFDKNHNWLTQTKITRLYGDTTSYPGDTVTREITYY